MTVFGVTGTHRLLTDAECFYVRKIVQRAMLGRPGRSVPRSIPSEGKKKAPHILVSGLQWGVDSEAILAVWGLVPFENIVGVIPGTAQHNYGLAERLAENGAQIIKGPTLHTARETYLARNEIVVEKMRVLLAFPQRPTFYRSGTWATINSARKANRKVRIYPLTNA